MPAGKINVYACPAGHETVTRDAVDGTTPAAIVCAQGGHYCFRSAASSWYDVDQGREPTHEFYRPTTREARRVDWRVPGTLAHVGLGGLLLRPIKTDTTNAAD